MSAGRIASVLLLRRGLLPLATSTTLAPTSIPLSTLAGPLLRASEDVLQQLLSPVRGTRWVQTVADQRVTQQYAEAASGLNFAQHRQPPLHSPHLDWHAHSSEDEFLPEQSASRREANLPRPLFQQLKQLAYNGKIDDLVELYRQEPALQSTHPFNVGLMSMPIRQIPEVYQTLVEELNLQPNAQSVALLIRSFGRTNRLKRAVAIWEDWQAQGLPLEPVVVGAMCGAYGIAGKPEAIEALIEQSKAAGLPPVMSAYTSLIKAYGAHSLVNVRRVLLEMKEDGVQPNQLHYRTAIVAHGACGRPQEAQYLLTEMAADGIEPDFLTIGSMVSAYADANQPRKAAAIMQDFLDSGGQATLVLCNMLAKAWARQGDIGEVRAVMANMRTLGIRSDVYTWSSLMYACAVAGQTGKAREAMKEMAGLGIAPNVVCYSTLLRAYATQGDMAAADDVLKDMLALGVRPNNYTYTSLMGWHSQLGNVNKVKALQQQMADEGIEADVVSHMLGIEAAMEAWDKAGRPEAALTQAEQLFQQSQVIKMKPLFKTNDPRSWRKTHVDLHGYCHWSCQLALLAGLRHLYQSYLTPGWIWPNADFVVVVGKGNNSAQQYQGHIRPAVLHFLQQLMPVRLAANNEGLVAVKRHDMLKFFAIMRRKHNPMQVANFAACFKPREQILDYDGPSMF